jgi:hypothetical protein
MLQRREAQRLDVRLVHERGEGIADLAAIAGCGRIVRRALDDFAYVLLHALMDHHERAIARPVGGDFRVPDPRPVDELEEIVPGLHFAVHPGGIEAKAAELRLRSGCRRR